MGAATLLALIVLLVWGVARGRVAWRAESLRLVHTAERLARGADERLDEQRRIIMTLGDALGRTRPATATDVSAWLAAAHGNHPAFISMLVADTTGRVVGATLADAAGRIEARHNAGLVADRTYFRAIMEGRASYVSGAFRGRGLGTDPIVAISAPLRDVRGRVVGVLEASLRLDGFRSLEAAYPDVRGLRLLVLDADSIVVYGGSDGRYPPLATPNEVPVVRAAAAGRLIGHCETVASGCERWVAAAAMSPRAGWHVIAMQPRAELVAGIGSFFGSLVLALTVTVLAMALVVVRMTRRVARPVEDLAAALRSFSVGAPDAALVCPPEAPREVAALIASFGAMAERTRNVLTGLLPICAACKRIRNAAGEWESVERYIRTRSEADFTHGVCPECAARLGYPTDESP
jgi:flagellar biogenesis protein FliO